MGKGTELMPQPSKLAELIVAFFLPASRREEVLGDLCERYQSAGQYARDAIQTVPCVLFSELFRKGNEPMTPRIALGIFFAFAIGLVTGNFLPSLRTAPARFFPNAIPFLLLLMLWIVLLVFQQTRRKPKC
jgi:hypothetical protein